MKLQRFGVTSPTVEPPQVNEDPPAATPPRMGVSASLLPENTPIPIERRDRFLFALGRALHEAGTPSNRLEDTLTAIGSRMGLETMWFSTPISLTGTIGEPGEEPRTLLLRVEPGEIDLSRLEAIDGIAWAVARGDMRPSEGLRALAEMVREPPQRRPLLYLTAGAAASAAAAVLLQGSWPDVAASAILGLFVTLLFLLAAPSDRWARLIDFGCGASAAVGAAVCASAGAMLGIGLSPFTITIAGLIMLVPGLTLTTAVSELVSRHLVSGTARLMHAAIIFVAIVFGIALGTRIASGLPLREPLPPTPSVEPWALAPALAVAAAAFTLLFRAPLSKLALLLIAGITAVGGARLGGWLLGPDLGAVLGAYLVGLVANAFARLRGKPASIVVVPGIIMLVPGMLGLHGFSSMFERGVSGGLEIVFTAVLIAASITIGLLLASATLRPRHTL